MNFDDMSPVQVIASLLYELSIGELKAIEDIAMDRRIDLQRATREKIRESVK